MITEGDAIHLLTQFFKDRWITQVYELANNYPDTQVLEVDYSVLANYNRELECLIEKEPVKLFDAVPRAIKNIELPIDVELNDVSMKIIDFPHKTPIRNIRHKHILQFICVEGIVRRVSSVKPKYTSISFECMRCGHVTVIPQPAKKVVEPYECENESCGRKGPFKINQLESTYTDYQIIEVQESPDSLNGAQPRNIMVNVYDELVDTATAGDKVMVSGILNTTQQVSKEGKTTISDIVLEANHIERMDKGYDELDITEQDMMDILEMSRHPNIKQMIIDSIAPSIYGLDDVKEALTLQLFSGVVKVLPDGTRLRGDTHILLIGDPGTAKSQLVKRIVALSPRGIFNSGKSASGVGLTATVVKDTLNDDRWTLEGGSLVMADGGLCAVDEMDKMSVEDRSALHEAMEQQVITISKASIHAQLMTRCALVGAANPIHGRFDRYDNDIAGQINMSPTLLSRFDLIFIIQDIPDKENDMRIAKHISNNHVMGGKILNGHKDIDLIEPPINQELLRKYVAYARANIQPMITPEAKEIIEKFYVNVRNASAFCDSVPLTARKIDGLYRMAESCAKTRLGLEVTVKDAQDAIRLVVACLKQIGVEEDTGMFNVDVIEAHGSKSQREKMINLNEFIKNKSEFSLNDVLINFGWDKEHSLSYITKFKHEGKIIQTGTEKYKVC